MGYGGHALFSRARRAAHRHRCVELGCAVLRTPLNAMRNRHDAKLIWEGHKAGREISYCHLEKLHNLEALPAVRFHGVLLPRENSRAPRPAGRARWQSLMKRAACEAGLARKRPSRWRTADRFRDLQRCVPAHAARTLQQALEILDRSGARAQRAVRGLKCRTCTWSCAHQHQSAAGRHARSAIPRMRRRSSRTTISSRRHGDSRSVFPKTRR